MRCAALVGAKPAKLALPRRAEVLPVTIKAPLPAATIAGVVSRARCSNAIVLISKLRLRISGSISPNRSEEHTSELQSLMRISYAVFCLKKKRKRKQKHKH